MPQLPAPRLTGKRPCGDCALVVVQELRDDAEATGSLGQADLLASSSARLGGDAVSPARAARRASLRGAGPVATLREVRRTVSLCYVGAVLQGVLIALGVITGLIPPGIETFTRDERRARPWSHAARRRGGRLPA